ncbi:MAG: ParB/RepB/Spo0J family partition protein [bacterium]|nr:ParB/RepB/Spo0J family partition protein [bacterium]
MPRRGLGRGLDALIPGIEEGEFQELPVSSLRPSPFQPRQTMDEDRLEELVQSIREHGVVQPVVVRRAGEHYELVVGERRWRAAARAGLQTIPALVRDFSDSRAVELALIENLQREDLNPLDEAAAYRRLVDEFGLTQEAVAQRVGRDRSHIAHCLRLLNLEAEVQEGIRGGALSLGHGKVLAGVQAAFDQRRLARRVREEGLSVRALEELAGRRGLSARPSRVAAPAPPDAEIAGLEERMARRLGTRVRILAGKEGGRIEIRYFSLDELERLAGLLLGDGRDT